MTYLSKYLELHPEDRYNLDHVIRCKCPHSYFDGVPCYGDVHGHGGIDDVCVCVLSAGTRSTRGRRLSNGQKDLERQ